MTLTAPGEGCPRVSGCCCVTFVGASPRKDLRDRLDRALSEVSATALWKELPDADQPSMQEVSGEEEDDQRTVPEAWLVVVALLVGPVLLGGLLGLLIRARVRGKAPRIALFCALAAPALVAPFVLPVEWLLLGVWDGVLLGLLLAGAMAMVLWLWRRPSPWSLLLLVLSTLLSAAFLEVGSRQLPTPRLAARWQAGRLLAVAPPEADAADDERARLLYPDRFPEDLRVHLGDSLVHGNSVPLDETFVAHLGRIDPLDAHVNGGIPMVGPDFEYLLYRVWRHRFPVHRVLVHLFAGNDLFEAGMRYPFCNDGALLELTEGEPVWRCPELQQSRGWRHRFYVSLAPLPLRVLATRSIAARYLLLLFERVRLRPPAPDDALEVVSRSLAALRDLAAADRVPLTVVVLPDRTELEYDYEQSRARRLLLLQAARELGIPTIDATPFLKTLTAEAPIDQWFENELPHDVHFSRRTHLRFAEWLAMELELTP